MSTKLSLKSLIILATLALSACSQPTLTRPSRPSALKEIETTGKIIDLRSGDSITSQQLLTQLASAPRLIVGEKHDNEKHHLIEIWLIKNLPQQRSQGSVLLEMLTANQQPRVDQLKQWLKDDPMVREGRIQHLLSWEQGWPWEMYHGVVMQALRAPYPLLVANINRDRVQDLYKNPRIPAGKISTAPDVQNAIRETITNMHDGKIDQTQLNAMLAIQQQRDRFMAQQLLAAPTPALLIAGGYHAAKQMGVPLHMQDLTPASRPVVLMLAETGMNITFAQADYVWYVPQPEANSLAGL
ncbi:ChaN family lipoprotein [Hafnia alvei]|uniref:Haem-binding uptake Tiki superfamily ChaN domain-containing protein n=1 Tax=Hafnia alvei ATCC 51873 TaxID=1002364 RepID=G9YB86_HAFAL|nr:ChaN family lipoprotein [Hafnia alvei]EHM39526.1 hypothetical protein HMPREF0454_03865 [Hafnia alvei ATCC 51873]QQE43830.1 ChaN family lipoprotein [Hafnia alvei]